MFVVLLDYRAELAQIDALMPAHLAFLEQCYAAGVFIASGRRVPRSGGVILATGGSRQDIEEVMQRDPFVAQGAAEFEVLEFRVSQKQAGFRWR